MTDLEMMERAKMYIDKLANGIDPIGDEPVAEGDAVNHVRVSRCLFYVSDVLRQVIENGGAVGKAPKTKKSKPSKPAFFLSEEQAAQFTPSKSPISVSELAKRLNALADLETCHKMTHSAIVTWLLELGALELEERADGRSVKRPTPEGEALGIRLEARQGQYGEYMVTVYDQAAQQFILDHREAIAEIPAKKRQAAKREQTGRPWTADQEGTLAELYEQDRPIAEIALTMQRSAGSIRARLKKMGYRLQ